jgi:hypothetical protein
MQVADRPLFGPKPPFACPLTASQQSFDSGSHGTATVISANAYFRPVSALRLVSSNVTTALKSSHSRRPPAEISFMAS